MKQIIKNVSQVAAMGTVFLAIIAPAAAAPVTFSFSGVFDEVRGTAPQDDAFDVSISYDTDAALLAENCAALGSPPTCTPARFSPGTLYSYDPGSLQIDLTIGGNTVSYGPSVDPAPLFRNDLLWYRDNSNDRSGPDGFGPADGLTFGLLAGFSDFSGYQLDVVFRSGNQGIFNGPGLPSNPQALLGAEIESLLFISLTDFRDCTGSGPTFECESDYIFARDARISVPTPATPALLGLGLLGLRLRRKA